MTTTKQKSELHVAEDPISINRDIEDKEYSEHVEQAEYGKTGVRDIEYDDQEDPEHSRKGMRKLLRRNPSYNFIRDVAVADETPLDQGQVKRVSHPFLARANLQLEKRLWMMIVPALCIDYIFYYIDKT
jgi:hypothetical protein